MEKANRISSATCYITGVLGLTRTQEISDILGIILTALSIISMLICVTINIIGRIKKAAKDGEISTDELTAIRDEINKAKEHIDDEIKTKDSGEKEDGDGKSGN